MNRKDTSICISTKNNLINNVLASAYLRTSRKYRLSGYHENYLLNIIFIKIAIGLPVTICISNLCRIKIVLNCL